MRKQSPYLAVHVLVAFQRKQVSLTEEAFDEAFDEITSFLEKCNNERYRLVSLNEEGVS